MVKIPNRFEDLYPASVVEKVLDVLQQPDLSGKVRETLDRVGLGDVNPLEQVQQAWQQARSWVESVASDKSSLADTEIINATGQLFHSDFSGIPISATVGQSLMRSVMRFHDWQRVDKRADRAVAATLGDNEVAWASSAFAAMQTLLRGKKVFVAKTDLVRIQGVGNVESMLGEIALVEVGPSNGCTEEDWKSALGDHSDDEKICVLSLSPNMLAAVEAATQLRGASQFAKSVGVPHFGFLADGVLDDNVAQQIGMPFITERVETYFDAAVVPLELMIGGPRGAMVVGDDKWVQPTASRLREIGASLDTASRIAALLALQLASLDQEVDLGAVHCLLTNTETLKERARRLAVQLNDNGVIAKATEVSRNVPLGHAPWNRYKLENWAVALEAADSLDKLYDRLVDGETESGETLIPAIIPCRESEKLVLDLRFVDPKHDHLLVLALSNPTSASDSSVEKD